MSPVSRMSEAAGRCSTVVLLHGWPGLPSDYDAVVDSLGDTPHLTPTLLGFGEGYRHEEAEFDASADAHARRLLAHLDHLDITQDVVIAGYDIGSRIAQAALRLDPARFDHAVLTPAYPGIGDRSASPALAPLFWYQHFHRDPIASRLIDGNPTAVRDYLDFIWTSWKGPAAPLTHPHVDEIVEAYSRPGAFAASIKWYNDNRGYAATGAPINTPVTMLWPKNDPLFPIEWADNLTDHFAHATLQPVENCGHFLPFEQPDAIVTALTSFA